MNYVSESGEAQLHLVCTKTKRGERAGKTAGCLLFSESLGVGL